MFAEWLRRGGVNGARWSFLHFARACDRGMIEGLGPDDFDEERGTAGTALDAEKASVASPPRRPSAPRAEAVS